MFRAVRLFATQAARPGLGVPWAGGITPGRLGCLAAGAGCSNNTYSTSTAASLRRMHPELREKYEQLKRIRDFDADTWIPGKCDMLNDYMEKHGLKGCVVNVSGGVDSSVVLSLIHRAASNEGSPIETIVPIAQPIHSTSSIQARAIELCDSLGLSVITIDQSKFHTELCELVERSVGIEGGQFVRGQLRSYMRTPVAYYAAQLHSQEGRPSVVVGTGNYDEDGYLLYFCKAGDGVSDIQLIADLHKSEVIDVGYKLNVPESILVAPPSADLWEGQTDEDELGITYSFVQLYTEYMKQDRTWRAEFKKSLSEEALEEFLRCQEIADEVHTRNAHKANFPRNLDIY